MFSMVRLTVAVAALTLAACGGGGGSKTPGDATPNSSISSSSFAVSSSVFQSSSSSIVSIVSSASISSSSLAPSSSSISSSSLSSSSIGSSSAAEVVSVKIDGVINGFDEAGETMPLDNQQVTVELVLLDVDEQPLINAIPVVSRHSTSTELRFSADLSAPGATSLALHISAPGHLSYARKLAAESKVTVDAKLQAVAVQTVMPGTVTAASGATLDGFNIHVSGDTEQQSNSLLINIPQSLLPDGTNSLEVAVRTFDPNEPDDAEFFPGAYADSDGNELASVGFNFAEIKTPDNQPIVQAMRQARQQKIAKAGGVQKAAAEEPITINYQIPAASCRLLESLGDSAPNIAGFQIPVYTYNGASGLWDLIGQGTLYNEAGQAVAATEHVFDCVSTYFTLEILVTNDIFLREWWNLDYPLAFTQPTNYCAQVLLKNAEGQNLNSITGYVMDQDDTFSFASTAFVTDENGMARIQVSQSGINPDQEAEVFFYGEGEFGYVTDTISLSSDCTNPPLQVITLQRPKLCEVSGKFVYENGMPVTRNLVYGFSEELIDNILGYDFSNSNAQGDYRLNLPCGGPYTLLSFAGLLSGSENHRQTTHINGSLDPDEQSDNGEQVVMKTQTVQHAAPLIMGSYHPDTNELLLMIYGVYDAFPLTATINIKNVDTGTVLDTITTQIDLDSQAEDGEMAWYFVGTKTFTRSLPAADGYLIQVNIVDGLGKTWPDIAGWIYVGAEPQ